MKTVRVVTESKKSENSNVDQGKSGKIISLSMKLHL